MKKLTILCAAAALAAILAACSDGGTPDGTGDNTNPPIAGDSRPEGGGSGVAGGGSTGNENGTGDADTLSLSERLAQDGAEVSLGGYQLASGSTYTVAGRNVTVSGGNADGASFVVKADGVRFINVRGIGSLVVDKEVGEGDFSAEGCEVSTMLVNGGGANSVHIVGGKMGDILVLKETVRIALAGEFVEPVKGIYSLAGEFKGTIDTKGASSLKIEKADAKIAAKAEGADIEDKDAAVPPEAMEAVREFSPEAVDILNGRAFAVNTEDEDNESTRYGYGYFGNGFCYSISSETEKTLSEIKEEAEKITELLWDKIPYKIVGGKLELLQTQVESGEIVPKRVLDCTFKDGNVVFTSPRYYSFRERTDNSELYFYIGLPDWIMGSIEENETEYRYNFFVQDESFLNSTPGNSGTIPFTVQKLKWNSTTEEDEVDSDHGLQTVTAQYTVTGGDIGSEGSTMTLKFELEGRTYTVSSETLGTTEFTYSEVTE